MAPRLNIPLRLGFWSYLVLRRHSRPQQLARTWVIDSRGQRLGAVSSIHRFRDIYRSRRWGDVASRRVTHQSGESGLIMTQGEQPTVWNRPLDAKGLTSTTGLSNALV